ncbi:hypothetical protein K9L16_01190 [Candidatus Pacearchaeota archaeon]|nr:hypothetical protein [Candidatus Pacearchaeota archaeon]
MAQAKKKKKFFEVDMPLIKKKTHLYAFKIEDIDKRTIRYDMTRILKGKNMLLDLDVSVKEGEATSEPRQLKLLPSFLRRMVKKRTNYVEDSFTIKCNDAKIRIKTILITRRKVSRAVRKALREKSKKELEKYIKDKKINELFDDILKNKLQKHLSLILKKIYPLSLCEIKTLRIEEKFTKEISKEETKDKKENTKTDSEKVEEEAEK